MGNFSTPIDRKPSLFPSFTAIDETTKKAAGTTVDVLRNLIYKIYTFFASSLKALIQYTYLGVKILKAWALIGYAYVKQWSYIIAKQTARYTNRFVRISIHLASIGWTNIKTFATLYRSQLLLAGGGALAGAALYALVDTMLKDGKSTKKA